MPYSPSGLLTRKKSYTRAKHFANAHRAYFHEKSYTQAMHFANAKRQALKPIGLTSRVKKSAKLE